MKINEILGKIYYHGTSDVYIEEIKKKGIIPNNEYFTDTVFVSGDYSEAEKYAAGTAKIAGGKPIVVIVRIADEQIFPDDASSAEQDAFAVNGIISPNQIINIEKVR